MVAAGGLHILGTERHESRRIDNQLRGRVGPPGRPGFEPLLPLPRGRPAAHLRLGPDHGPGWSGSASRTARRSSTGWITRAIENAQKKVEAHNFDIRKHLLEYDDVMNKQRTAFYGRRRALLESGEVHAEVLEMIEGVLVQLLAAHWPEKGEPDEEQLAALVLAAEAQFGVAFDPRVPPFEKDGRRVAERDAVGRGMLERLVAFLDDKARHWDEVVAQHPDAQLPGFHQIEAELLRMTLDRLWKDHLHGMDALRESVRLRGYAQKDPKIEYAREGYAMFEEMNARADQQVVEQVFKMTISEEALQRPPPRPVQPAATAAPAARPAAPGSAIERLPGSTPPAGLRAAAPAADRSAAAGKVGRNDPCTCGSGKKYKKCCGAT